jgi:phosphopantothenoylcysteine decarboxylase/phosphopantothenate--cysteine ligase
VVSAGGTREALDPVRYLSNRSSGKQGYALAEVAAARGAKVTLVTTVERPVPPGVETVAVESAEQLLEAMRALTAVADVVIMAAAVADYRPKAPAATKLKRRDGLPELVLEATPDVLAELAHSRPAGQTLVGFAAETEDPLGNGARKLKDKGVDLVVVNDVARSDAGFGSEDNEVTILSAAGQLAVPLAPKHEIADAVLDAVLQLRAGAAKG